MSKCCKCLDNVYTLDELKEDFSHILKLDKASIDENNTFQNYGLDSISAIRFSVHLKERLDMEIPPNWFLEHPSFNQFFQKIQQELNR